MTGPEHYRQAELHCEDADSFELKGEPVTSAWHQQQAQVHATLALAAATALGSPGRAGGHGTDGMDPADRLAWEDTASAAAPARDDDDPAAGDYDPGPEVDDEGGMSEYRYAWPEGEAF